MSTDSGPGSTGGIFGSIEARTCANSRANASAIAVSRTNFPPPSPVNSIVTDFRSSDRASLSSVTIFSVGWLAPPMLRLAGEIGNGFSRHAGAR